MPINVELRARLTPTVRHEFGHWVVARHLGFRTGYVYVEHEKAGASIELIPSLTTMDEYRAGVAEARVVRL